MTPEARARYEAGRQRVYQRLADEASQRAREWERRMTPDERARNAANEERLRHAQWSW